MNILKKFINNKFWSIAICFSIIIGVLYFYPDYSQKNSNERGLAYYSYNVSDYFVNRDELAYGPSIRRYYDLFNGDSYKSLPELFIPQIIPLGLAALIAHLLPDNIESFFYYKNLVFPIIGFLSCVYLLRALFNNSIVIIFLALLVYHPYFNIHDILNYINIDYSIWEEKKEFIL